jgi:hypothetical protein
MAEEVPKLKKVWVKIDPWRGYYTYELPEEEKKRAKILDLSFVARDPEENEQYLKTAMELLKKAGFKVRKKIFPTSNVFSMNIALLVYKDTPFTPEEEQFLKEFHEKYVDYYNQSFSIFTGETYPIPIEEFKKAVSEKAKEILGKAIGD